MKSKIFSQNNMGGALLLLFFLFASQTRLFNFFIDTVLGRMVLIILLIITSYLNKILGVIFVLMIIIFMNNQKRDYYMEGFTADASGNSRNDASGNATGSGKPTPAKIAVAKKAKDASVNSVEGFDVLGIENTLKRGKNSNTMNSQGGSQGNSSYVEPFHESFFGNSFTAFSGNSS